MARILLAPMNQNRAIYGIPCESEFRAAGIRAKHATIARLRLQALPTPFAVIEELAGVGRHGLGCLMSTMRTSEGRIQLHQRFARTILGSAGPIHGRER